MTKDNAWLSGFLDSGGSIYLNLLSAQLIFAFNQKKEDVLLPLQELFGGKIYRKISGCTWLVYRKEEGLALRDYFIQYSPHSAKRNRILAINRYHELRGLGAHRATPNSALGKLWSRFIQRWNRWGKI